MIITLTQNERRRCVIIMKDVGIWNKDQTFIH